MAMKYGISGSGYSVHQGDVSSFAHKVGTKYSEEHPKLAKKHPKMKQGKKYQKKMAEMRKREIQRREKQNKQKVKATPEERAERRRIQLANIAVKKEREALQQAELKLQKKNNLLKLQTILKETANGTIELCCEVNEEMLENVYDKIAIDGKYIFTDKIQLSYQGRLAILHRLDHFTFHYNKRLYELMIDSNASKISLLVKGNCNVEISLVITKIFQIESSNFGNHYEILDSAINSRFPSILILWNNDERI